MCAYIPCRSRRVPAYVLTRSSTPAIAHSRQGYPERLRRIRFFDEETQRFFVYLTNNFALPALTIAQLYKSRWQVELFFKWIKQHLRIKRFMGTSVNAVKTQIWIAICVHAQVAILKKQLDLPQSLYKILRILMHMRSKRSLWQNYFVGNSEPQDSGNADCNQLQLFQREVGQACCWTLILTPPAPRRQASFASRSAACSAPGRPARFRRRRR